MSGLQQFWDQGDAITRSVAALLLAELTAALTAGFQPITLGPLVLRSDTAAIYALSILSYELQGR